MKKKTLSPDALAIMLGENKGTEPTEEEILKAAKAAEALKAEEAAEALKVEEAAKAKKNEEATQEEKLEALKAEISTLQEEATANDTKHVEALKAKETEAVELKEIVVDNISKMRIALKISAVDMSDWKIEAVVQEFNTTRESFVASFPVGSVIPEKKKEKETEAKVIDTSLDSAAYASLGFK